MSRSMGLLFTDLGRGLSCSLIFIILILCWIGLNSKSLILCRTDAITRYLKS
jgi:hypothetical protein